jgi:holo-[acyl-carrier protein] synthase
MITGIGTDLVDVERIQRMLERFGDRFTGRVYSPHECDYCRTKAVPAIHFAARFAAKESLLKSMGIGLGMGVNLKDIEVRNNPEGRPALKLYGKASEMMREMGVTAVHLSLTHTRTQAIAAVVLEKNRSADGSSLAGDDDGKS